MGRDVGAASTLVAGFRPEDDSGVPHGRCAGHKRGSRAELRSGGKNGRQQHGPQPAQQQGLAAAQYGPRLEDAPTHGTSATLRVPHDGRSVMAGCGCP